MVDQVFVNVLPEGRIPILVHLLARDGGQCGRGVHGFGKRPVHAVGDNGLAVPIGGVSQTDGAFGVPGVGKCLSEQVLGGFDKLLLAFFGTLLGAQRILGDETCPLDAMARSGAYGLNWSSGLSWLHSRAGCQSAVRMLRNMQLLLAAHPTT